MASSKRLVVLALPWLWACSASPDALPKAAVVEVTPPTPPATPAPPPPDPPREPEPFLVELPAKPACVLQGTWRARKGTTDMLVRPGGPAFAAVSSGNARLHFPDTSAAGAGPGFPAGTRPPTQGLELEADGISVRGHVGSEASDLRAARPFWLSGLALPTTYTMFDWTEAAAGMLTVTTVAPNRLEIVSPPLTATRPCPDIALETGSFDPDSAIEGIKKAKPGQLVTDHPVDVALDPGGKAVARAWADEGYEDVQILEARGGSTRIAWSAGSLRVVGWVASRDVHKPKRIRGFGSGHGRIGGPHYANEYKKVVCSIDVQLVVELDGERAIPGVVRAGTVFELVSANDRYTAVRVRSERIVPSPDARWTVPTDDLRDCQSPP